MNHQNLKKIFSNYIEKFEFINNNQNDENYKWRIAHKFHDLMDPYHPDFETRMVDAWKLSQNLIDSNNRYCFGSLVKCLEEKPKSVQDLFKALFADDGGDLAVRQQKIQQFIKDANALTAHVISPNPVFMNDQRSTMGYLFLYDPDKHYLYKATEATDFASCIEFYDDWGPGTNFRLDVFYRMCDMLVEEIRKSPELKETHESRYTGKDGKPIEGMHPDKNYHILAFDIIYGAPDFRYNFYNGIPFSKITAPARKLHQERVKKAQALYTDLQSAREKADMLQEARAYFESVITAGLDVKSKAYGEGKIVSADEKYVAVTFTSNGATKRFEKMKAFTGGYLIADMPDLAEKIAMYRDVVNREASIENNLTRAEAEFSKYSEYLE